VNGVSRVICLQVLVTAVIALVLLSVKGGHAAVSALVGGAIGFSASALYALTISFPRSNQPKDVLRAHYRAEVYKLLGTFFLFVAVFSLFPDISAPMLLLAFAGTLIVYWTALLFA
jgi:ATP synthase protein I